MTNLDFTGSYFLGMLSNPVRGRCTMHGRTDAGVPHLMWCCISKDIVCQTKKYCVRSAGLGSIICLMSNTQRKLIAIILFLVTPLDQCCLGIMFVS